MFTFFVKKSKRATSAMKTVLSRKINLWFYDLPEASNHIALYLG